MNQILWSKKAERQLEKVPADYRAKIYSIRFKI